MHDGWLGETEGIDLTLTFLRQKRERPSDTAHTTVLLGLPARPGATGEVNPWSISGSPDVLLLPVLLRLTGRRLSLPRVAAPCPAPRAVRARHPGCHPAPAGRPAGERPTGA